MKEMFIPEVAEAFQLAGITALIYDPRNTGMSEGQPRNEIDPMKQIEDYSDAATFLGTLSIVDPNCIGFWGMSFSATIAVCGCLGQMGEIRHRRVPIDGIRIWH